jgi:uncharacterized membrane protein
MTTVSFSRLVDGGVDQTWQVFTDLPARPAWLCTVDRIEVLTAGPFGAGTAWRESRRLPGGDSVTEELLVLAADPPGRLVIASAGIGVDYRTTYQFRPVRRRRTQTVVTVVQEGTHRGRYGRWVAVILGGLAARAVEGVLRRDLTDLAVAVRTAGTGSAEAA